MKPQREERERERGFDFYISDGDEHEIKHTYGSKISSDTSPITEINVIISLSIGPHQIT